MIQTLRGYYSFLIKSRWRQTFFIALTWQLAILVIGILIDPSQGFLGHMVHWDAGWYKHVIDSGYSLNGSPAAPAFYPLYPSLVWLLSTLSFNVLPLSFYALVINTIALWLLIYALLKILDNFEINKYGKYAALTLLLTFPSAFFMHVFYTEALFITIGFWAYLFALQRRWWAVGLTLACLTASRLPSILFVLLCGLEYLSSYRWKIKDALNAQVLWFLLAPMGFVLYAIYLHLVRDDALAMFSAYSKTKDWGYHVFNLNIFSTIWLSLTSCISDIVSRRASYEPFINRLLPFASLTLVLISSCYLALKNTSRYIPVAATGLASIVMFSLNSNLISVHRYSLGVLCIYLAVAKLCKSRRTLIAISCLCLVSLALQMVLYGAFIDDIFAG